MRTSVLGPSKVAIYDELKDMADRDPRKTQDFDLCQCSHARLMHSQHAGMCLSKGCCLAFRYHGMEGSNRGTSPKASS